MGGPDDGEDPWNINILETEGIWDVTALDIPIDLKNKPLKFWKVNIGTEDNQKFANVGDYWDE